MSLEDDLGTVSTQLDELSRLLERLIEVLESRVQEPRALARMFHETYERLAPDFGYETREDTREFDPDSNNGRLMTAVIRELLERGVLS